AIEQDADVVLFIHRESYYSDAANKNTCKIRIAKNREGRTGEFDFWVDDYITNFLDEDPSTMNIPQYYNNENTPF
ncbi:DnaB-like helicase C-terminal domain-containing protein, partial [Proteiniphilum sp. UBA5384]|uniref:DnaB-like helicase C-terminal domain-containing protein n=1 Tax=Proteiniphilum sp. UBA5384 TaxID=1947279 RepID=UPI0025F4D100